MSSPLSKRPGAGPQLITDTPVLAIIDAMGSDLERLRLLAPSSDSRALLEMYFQKLTDALRDARDGDVWLSTEQAAQIRGTTPQAITHLCRKGKIEARKRGGCWEVHKDSVLRDVRGAA